MSRHVHHPDSTIKYLALSELYLPNKGGHIVWFDKICRHLGNVLLLTQKLDNLPDYEVDNGLQIRRVSLSRVSFLRPESLFLYLNFFLEGLKSNRKHLEAIISARVLPEGLIGNILSKIFKIPHIVIAHGEEVNRSRGNIKLPSRRKITNILKRYFLWNTYKNATHIVANSHFTLDLLTGGGVHPSQITVIHPGVDTNIFQPSTQKDFQLIQDYDLQDKKILLTVGRLTPRKGQDMTIKALKYITKQIPNVVYVIAGSGNYRSELEALANSLGVSSHVRFIGPISDKILPKLYNVCDVFLMPNRTTMNANDIEGFGIVFLEASACGKPVIGGNSGGVPDAILDNITGMLIDAGDPLNIARAVIHILENEKVAHELGKRGRSRVINSLSWEHSMEKFETVLKNIR